MKKVIAELKSKLIFETKWNADHSNNLQETHLHVTLEGDLIYAQYVCVNQYGSMYDCNIFADAISAKGFNHIFPESGWFLIEL